MGSKTKFRKSFKKIKKLEDYKILKIFLSIIISLILVYIIFYLIFILPLYTIHNLQPKKWITDLTHDIILGVNDRSLFKKRNLRCDNISFWYCYWFFQTKKYTTWILFNLQNKFSDVIMLNIYHYDFDHKTKIIEQIPLHFSNLKTEKINNKLVISCEDKYMQEIDFENNTSHISINTNKINISLNLSIDDYTTNQASFIPRYRLLNNICDVSGSTTGSPGEWMSDNPFIGKIRGGKIQNDIIENGDFWFDNFIGCNNNFLGPYTWFVVLNDDWLIYLLWFDNYEHRNKISTAKPILIKHLKTNTFIYSGVPGTECRVIPPLDTLHYSLQPFSITYNTNKSMGVEHYDDYMVSFKSEKINVNISSIQGESHQVFKYYYYRNEETDEMRPTMNKWDQKYYDVLSNIIYVEYINMVDVTIEYNGKIERFKARQVIDSMYPEDFNIPTIIKYNS